MVLSVAIILIYQTRHRNTISIKNQSFATVRYFQLLYLTRALISYCDSGTPYILVLDDDRIRFDTAHYIKPFYDSCIGTKTFLNIVKLLLPSHPSSEKIEVIYFYLFTLLLLPLLVLVLDIPYAVSPVIRRNRFRFLRERIYRNRISNAVGTGT